MMPAPRTKLELFDFKSNFPRPIPLEDAENSDRILSRCRRGRTRFGRQLHRLPIPCSLGLWQASCPSRVIRVGVGRDRASLHVRSTTNTDRKFKALASVAMCQKRL
jgi:hypothetical protein